jgi:hypothetical protein
MYFLSTLTVGIQLQKYFSSITYIKPDINVIDLEGQHLFCTVLLQIIINVVGGRGRERCRKVWTTDLKFAFLPVVSSFFLL